MKPDNNLFLHATYVVMGLALFIGSKTAHSAEQATASSKVLAEVDGRAITEDTLKKYQRFRGVPKDANPEQQKRIILEELINRELLYLDAIEKGVDQQPEVKADIENQKINIIAGVMLKQATDSVKLSDDELKQAYEQHIKTLPAMEEYKASHILLETEQDAKAVIAELDKGADFTQLAKEKSTGPSGPSGGGLGWFQAGQMVESFTDAVAKLKNGQFSKTPVKTQFGWHVVLREESRNIAPPDFSALKEQLRMRLMNKIVENYIGSLKNKAKIKRY